ncbi:MAG: sugar transferase [Actinobacteria bacterium]|nr:sugar transferase [Actinomycetota bacterium]
MTRRFSLLATFAGPILVVIGMSKVHAAWVAERPYDYTGSFRFAWSIAYIVILLVTTYGLGLPDLARSTASSLKLAFTASAVSAIGISLVQLVVGDALLPRFVVFGAALLLVPWQVAVGWIVRRGLDREADRDRVVLVASESEAERLTDEQRSTPEKPWRLEAHLRPEDVVGGAGRVLVDTVLAGSTVVVLDRSALVEPEVIAQAGAVHEFGIRVRTLQQFYEEWLAKLPMSELERSSLFFDIAEVHRVRYGRAKRLLDLAGGVVGLVPLVLGVPAVWLLNLFGNRGPLLYRQERVGRNGATFTILKFRTMLPDDPSAATDAAGGSAWTTEDDPRITPIGRLLRKSHLDELPQVWNIVRGDLSLVGPRPEQPRYVHQLSGSLPFYGMRHLVRPGLTGWAQVKYGYAGDEDDALEKLQYEFFYLRHQSFGFDLKVLGRTIRSVLGSEGGGR